MRNGVSGDVLQTLCALLDLDRDRQRIGSASEVRSLRGNKFAVELYDRVYPGPELIPFTRLMSPKTT